MFTPLPTKTAHQPLAPRTSQKRLHRRKKMQLTYAQRHGQPVIQRSQEHRFPWLRARLNVSVCRLYRDRPLPAPPCPLSLCDRAPGRTPLLLERCGAFEREVLRTHAENAPRADEEPAGCAGHRCTPARGASAHTRSGCGSVTELACRGSRIQLLHRMARKRACGT